MPHESWYYFLSLEADLYATARYVEPSEANDSTFSIEFARILTSASAEIEVVSTLLLSSRIQLSKSPRISELRVGFQEHFPKLPSMEVLVPRTGRRLRPWSAWAGNENPAWWIAHNAVKHDRHGAFSRATLRNALNAVGALMCLQLYLHHELYNAGSLEPWCRLLTLEKHYETIVAGEGGVLPDFPRGLI